MTASSLVIGHFRGESGSIFTLSHPLFIDIVKVSSEPSPLQAEHSYLSQPLPHMVLIIFAGLTPVCPVLYLEYSTADVLPVVIPWISFSVISEAMKSADLHLQVFT